MVRKIAPKGGSIFLELNNTLLFQMQFLQMDSMRVGIAFCQKGEYFCGYLRNMAAKKEALELADRSICKLVSMNKAAFVAYWTEGGILSVMFRDEKKFDDEFYRMKLCGYHWEDNRLTAYLEAPLLSGDAKLTMQSVSTKTVCLDVAISMERAGNTGLKTVWKMTVDLSGMASDNSDGYRLLCELNGHTFQVFWDGEIDEDNLCRITLRSGETLDACVIQDENGQFILKTGRVYPVMLSIVTAVYNTAPFLAEMIHSVLSQKVDKLQKYCMDYRRDYFQSLYEFILVDDGSTDGSGDILDDYAGISDRIKVIHKENGGVSSARNAGIEVARGKYINFADSDDRLSENFVEECLLFFEKHLDEIDIVTTPLKFFDASKGDHWTNYKFKNRNRVIDLQEEPNAVFVSTCCTLFKTCDVMKYSFDTSLVNGEDIAFIYKLVIKGYQKIGVVDSCYYGYRRRSTGESSAINQSPNDPRTYTDYIENVLKKILMDSMDENGEIPKFVQYGAMGQLQWKFELNDKGELGKRLLGEEEFCRYKEKAFSLLQYIDDDIIVSQKKIWSEHFYYLLKQKYKCLPQTIYKNNDVYFEFQGTRIRSSFGNCYISINFLDIKNGILHIEGYSMNYMPEAKLLLYVNSAPIQFEIVERDVNKYIFDEIVFYATTFSVDIVLENYQDKYEIEFHGKLNEIEVIKKELRFTKFMPLAQSYRNSFYIKEGWTVRREGAKFVVYNMSVPMFITKDFEKDFEQEISKSKDRDRLKYILELRRQASLRLAEKGNKKIYLISDRVNTAGDNGEAMFRFCAQNPDPDVEPYFVISSESPDFVRMQEFGRVVPYWSREHYVLHLIADYIVSSAADEFVINPWFAKKAEAELVRDFLARPRFIFLQHGVIKDDMSEWLNRYNKNITGFICTTEKEAQSIIECNYCYKRENVWLTGLPRHDRLYHDEKNYITIMPTWRQYLSATNGKDNELVQDFVKSDYFMFYNKLINDDRLLSKAEEQGYKICFMPHPGIKRNGLSLFYKNPRVEFFDFDIEYRKVYAESKLVVTDYSSSVMDFALLHKPVVYCHFDKEEFFNHHLYKEGYFDYERDGFGEVTYDMESLIDVMIMYMKDDCKVHDPYGKRMDDFFQFHDKENCRRVYEKIKSLS